MGIYNLWKIIENIAPKCKTITQTKITGFDYLCIDCSFFLYNIMSFPKLYSVVLNEFVFMILSFCERFRPRVGVYLAFDGCPPVAKKQDSIIQFRISTSDKKASFQRLLRQVEEAGTPRAHTLAREKLLSIQDIYPNSPVMFMLAFDLLRTVAGGKGALPSLRGVSFFAASTSATYGEGEIKMLSFAKSISLATARRQQVRRPSFGFLTADSDVILSVVAMRLPSVTVVRPVPTRSVITNHHLSPVFRSFFATDLDKLLRHIPAPYELDFVLAMLLSKSDFLPHFFKSAGIQAYRHLCALILERARSRAAPFVTHRRLNRDVTVDWPRFFKFVQKTCKQHIAEVSANTKADMQRFYASVKATDPKFSKEKFVRSYLSGIWWMIYVFTNASYTNHRYVFPYPIAPPLHVILGALRSCDISPSFPEVSDGAPPLMRDRVIRSVSPKKSAAGTAIEQTTPNLLRSISPVKIPSGLKQRLFSKSSFVYLPEKGTTFKDKLRSVDAAREAAFSVPLPEYFVFLVNPEDAVREVMGKAFKLQKCGAELLTPTFLEVGLRFSEQRLSADNIERLLTPIRLRGNTHLFMRHVYETEMPLGELQELFQLGTEKKLRKAIEYARAVQAGGRRSKTSNLHEESLLKFPLLLTMNRTGAVKGAASPARSLLSDSLNTAKSLFKLLLRKKRKTPAFSVCLGITCPKGFHDFHDFLVCTSSLPGSGRCVCILPGASGAVRATEMSISLSALRAALTAFQAAQQSDELRFSKMSVLFFCARFEESAERFQDALPPKTGLVVEPAPLTGYVKPSGAHPPLALSWAPGQTELSPGALIAAVLNFPQVLAAGESPNFLFPLSRRTVELLTAAPMPPPHLNLVRKRPAKPQDLQQLENFYGFLQALRRWAAGRAAFLRQPLPKDAAKTHKFSTEGLYVSEECRAFVLQSNLITPSNVAKALGPMRSVLSLLAKPFVLNMGSGDEKSVVIDTTVMNNQWFCPLHCAVASGSKVSLFFTQRFLRAARLFCKLFPAIVAQFCAEPKPPSDTCPKISFKRVLKIHQKRFPTRVAMYHAALKPSERDKVLKAAINSVPVDLPLLACFLSELQVGRIICSLCTAHVLQTHRMFGVPVSWSGFDCCAFYAAAMELAAATGGLNVRPNTPFSAHEDVRFLDLVTLHAPAPSSPCPGTIGVAGPRFSDGTIFVCWSKRTPSSHSLEGLIPTQAGAMVPRELLRALRPRAP
eukprot:gnl/Chilomastix_cuspidata/3968.p1 GENE.gnl/Chilomastix_cuspidata/3968~~gnl/Chilomastix_cuspidata/3968.p1  ORF type:complete len:1222 (-),score=429.70 gnl/Chilomastix_cuspidata/3968:17-3682(-)